MKKIVIVFFMILILLEIFILQSDNNRVLLSNKELENMLKEKDLIKENDISLSSIYKERDEKKQELENIFGEDSFEDLISNEEKINVSLKEEITSLESEIISLESSVTSLESEYSKLTKEYEEKNSFYIEGVPTINQYPDYPTGCEAVSLTILLNYYNISVTAEEIVNALDKEPLIYTKDEIKYGGNPELGFIGDPKTSNSFGVYEKPIAKLANIYKPGINVATGTSFEDILNIVKGGKSVLVWTSMNLVVPYISRSWIYEPTGETIYWKANEHAVVIIGYTPDKVIISDPMGGKIKYQSLTLFKERYDYFGKRALYY